MSMSVPNNTSTNITTTYVCIAAGVMDAGSAANGLSVNTGGPPDGVELECLARNARRASAGHDSAGLYPCGVSTAIIVFINKIDDSNMLK
jgi:hypothetical protein